LRERSAEVASGDWLDALQAAVESWFRPAAIAETMGPPGSPTERTAREWLAAGGKRWRPLLAACAYAALREEAEADWPVGLRCIALAVECFHKASLIHDDIEDGDTERYGREALHVRLGTATALNVGDLLVGEGYRLLADLAVTDECKARLVRAAAHGHRSLCLGQGRELEALGAPAPPTSREVLDIFRGKTGPAFEVAVCFGAVLAGASEDLWPMLGRYSEALGVAYQIRDDLDDWAPGGADRGRHVSIVLALARERTAGAARRTLDAFWRGTPAQAATDLERIVADTRAEEAARRLLESHRRVAVAALEPAAGRPIGRVLAAVVERMFERTEGGRAVAEAGIRKAAGEPLGAEPAPG